MSITNKIPCTFAEYDLAQKSLSSLRTTLEKAVAAPAGSKLHRGIAYFQQGIAHWDAFLASHVPVEGYALYGRGWHHPHLRYTQPRRISPGAAFLMFRFSLPRSWAGCAARSPAH